MGTLFLVSTPIGNLKDITIRAIEVLQMVDSIACEDTRRTAILLRSIQKDTVLQAKLISYYEENEDKRIPEIITALKNGLSLALVSDAGTPTISDPGFRLVRECVKEGIKVEPIPGPSAVIAALSASGLPTDRFLFLGYLPRKKGNRKKILKLTQKATGELSATVVFYEAPHRLVETLTYVMEIFGDIEIVLARELTKIHEEIKRGIISLVIERFRKTAPKGEFVILFHV